jgi:hypothetical protein
MEIYKVKHEKCFPRLHYKIKKNKIMASRKLHKNRQDDTVPETLDFGKKQACFNKKIQPNLK